MVDSLIVDYAGKKRGIFRLAITTSLLTLLTLGIYRFWMKTRIRRYYWSSVRPGDYPLEYVGQPVEKLLGFLMAVVFLSFYIGIVNLILMFLSFSLFQGNFAAYIASFVGVVPIWFFATYRARRYIIGRTRWRGIRLGMDPGAFGYAWRAIVHWLITIGSLGILWPRMVFWLEKYRTDRTHFGDQKFEQSGKWSMLYRPMLHLALSTVALVSSTTFIIVQTMHTNSVPLALVDLIFAEDIGQVGNLIFTIPLYVWFLYGLAYYKTKSFARLTETKQIGDTRFTCAPKPLKVFGIYVAGYVVVFLAMLAIFGIIGGVFVLFAEPVEFTGPFGNIFTGLAVAAYFAVFILWTTLTHALIKLPIARHFAKSTTLVAAEALESARQIARDEFADAEGFAEALDLGAAI